jgi:hypothetical protein
LVGVAIAISIFPWVYFIIGVMPAKGLNIEGSLYVAAFFGAVSFCLTGPLAAIVANSFWEYWAISAATLGYQTFVFESSAEPLFFPRVAWTSTNLWIECISAAALSVAWYLVFYVVIRRVGSQKRLPTALRAVGLAAFSFALIALLVIRSA